MRRPAAYIGMIGSRRRVYAVFKLLRDEGIPVEDLLRVHAPIGVSSHSAAVIAGAPLHALRRLAAMAPNVAYEP